ncbi:MAG: enoyl-CoA hydratase/isomerase family protein [Solirubrobacterales bacterium]
MRYRTLTYKQDEHVAALTYNRPEQRNAVSREMNAELHDAWRRFRDDDDAFVLVITGAGEAFCAGWDLADAAETRLEDWDEFRIARLPQGAIRSDKETLVRNVGRTFEEQLRQEAEACLSMFMRRDSHAVGARAFKEGRTPEWPHHGL